MSGQNEPEDALPLELRAMMAEVTYDLLVSAFVRLATAYERAAPGAFEPLNRELMQGVVADLQETQKQIPEENVAGAVFVQIATELHETLRAVEAMVSAPPPVGH
jgi:hypothetical protein